MISLDSSNLAAADYDPFNGTLTIQFRDGAIYEYYRVSYSAFAGLVSADSHGKYFHRHIKGHYDYRRIG